MTTANRTAPSKHSFKKTRRLLDAFFKVDEYHGAYERYDNTMSDDHPLLVFERGDSVAALLFDPAHREVILVEQFRLPVALRDSSGWILEPAAGMIEGDETPKEAMINELREETGYRVTDLEFIGQFFVSPGGTTERIFLYFAEVQPQQKDGEGGGLSGDGENIRTVRINVNEFFKSLSNNELHDAKLIIAAQWLKERLATRPPHEATFSPPVERRIKLPETKKRFSKAATPEKFVGYITGDIMNVRGIDVWVNPLSTDMLLDRFTDRTVSAKIRAHGAEKEGDKKRLSRDTIGEALKSAMGKRYFVAPAKFVETPPGELAQYGVKCILHMATSKGEMGKEYPIDAQTLGQCVDNALHAVADRYVSILIPMLGTGGGPFDVRQVAPLLLDRAIHFFEHNSRVRLKHIYFLPYTEIDAATFAEAMKAEEKRFEPVTYRTADGRHMPSGDK